jgi:isopentenyldiphosphate isomerase
VCFTKDRPSLKPEQANREVYIHINLARLDTPSDNPDEVQDVEYFEEETIPTAVAVNVEATGASVS